MKDYKNMPERTNPDHTIDPPTQERNVEVPLSTQTNATNVIPDEVPRRDGPGGQ